MNAAVAWQVAEVLESGNGHIRLRFSRPDSCQRCMRGEGCGAGVFSALFSRRTTEVEMPVELKVVAGQWVRVGISTRSLALSALAVYGLPLVGFIVGTLPAYWWVNAPLWRDLLSLGGGVLVAALAWRMGDSIIRFARQPVVEPLSCRPDATKSSTI